MFGINRFFDRAKGVAIAAGAASLLAIAGAATLAVSAAMTLQILLPEAAAYAAVGVFFLAVSAIAMWVGLQPKEPDTVEEASPAVDPVEAVLDMIDLPVDVATQIIKTRPVSTTLAVAGVGLLIAWRPKVALGMVDSLLARLAR